MVQTDSLLNNTVCRLDSISVHVDSIHDKLGETHYVIKAFDLPISDELVFWVSAIAMLFGVLAAVFGVLTYTSQKKTMENTNKVSTIVQKSQLRDMTRHLYRNLICTVALAEEHFRKVKFDIDYCYPSEEHLLKLKFLPEDVIHIEKFVNNEAVASKMHEFSLLVRNYNVEVDVALGHIKDRNISQKVIRREFNTLTLKCIMFIKKILDIEVLINAADRKFRTQTMDNLLDRTIAVFMESHIGNVKRKLNDARVDWSRYVYTDFASDSTGVIKNQLDGLFGKKRTISRDVLMTLLSSVDSHKFMDGSADFSMFWSLTGEEDYKDLLQLDEIDIYRLMSIIISVDSSAERSFVNAINN